MNKCAKPCLHISQTEIVPKLLLLFLLVNATGFGQSAPPNDVRYYLRKATQSREEKNFPAFLENMQEVLRLRPGQPAYMYNLACAYALNGKKKRLLHY